MRLLSVGALVGAIVVVVLSTAALALAGREIQVVPLASGKYASYKWYSSVIASSANRRVSTSCDGLLLRDTTTEGGSPETEFGEDMTSVCKALGPNQAPIVLNVAVDEGSSHEGVIFSILAAVEVARVRLFMGSSGVKDVRLRRLGTHRSEIAGVDPLRFAAFAQAGPTCVTRIITFDASGSALFRSAREPCRR